MKKTSYIFLMFNLYAATTFSQSIKWKNQEFEIKNVTATLVQMDSEQVLKIERDLKALPFDINNLESTVDEPTYVRLKNISFKNGIIEVKVLSVIQNPSPFKDARGFIGVAFRISEKDSAFESIYLRPQLGRSENQFARNHTVQYFSYPNYKFQRLRKEASGTYETYADIGLNEWITLRLEVIDEKARLYINGQKHPSFVVEKMKGQTTDGSIALWVDIGTEGYFKDLRVIKQ